MKGYTGVMTGINFPVKTRCQNKRYYPNVNHDLSEEEPLAGKHFNGGLEIFPHKILQR